MTARKAALLDAEPKEGQEQETSPSSPDAPTTGWVMYSLFESDERREEVRKANEKREREIYKERAFRDALQWKFFMDDRTKVPLILDNISVFVL